MCIHGCGSLQGLGPPYGHLLARRQRDYGGADPKLTELMNALSSRDSSQIAWNNPTQLQSDYDTFFAGLNRNQDFNTWKAEADQAAADMVAARTANPAPAAPPPSNPVQQLWDWLTGLFGG